MQMKDYFTLTKRKLFALSLIAIMLLGGGSSAWAQKALPYSYNFSTALTTEGWTMESCSSSTGISSGAFRFYYNSNPPQYLISPKLEAISSTVDVSFQYKVQSSTWVESFQVGYSTAEDINTASFEWATEVEATNTAYTEYKTTFPAGVKYVAIRYNSNDKYYLFIDDFKVCKTPTCITPTGLTTADITSSSVTLNWTSDADTWNVQYKKATDTNWTDVSGNIISNSYTLTGLEPATAYLVRVRTYCDASDQSEWTDAVSFTTDCGSITTFPFSENFNSITSGIPMCWDNSTGTVSSSYRWAYYASGHDGACVRFNSANPSNGQYNYLKTPVMNFPSGKTMQLSFWYQNPNTGDFSVYISNDGGSTYTTALAEGLSASSWTQKEIVIPNGFTENVVIVFKGTSNYGYNYIYIDDVLVEEAPACVKPTDLTATNVAARSVDLSWTIGDEGQDTWQIVYDTNTDFDPDAATPVAAGSNPFTLTGLTPETTYYAYVRAYCSTSDQSDWSNKVSFTTTPSCITPTAFAASNVTLNSATLTWTDETGQTAWEVSYSTTSGAPNDGTIVAVTEKSYEITDLTAGTTYYASVRAVNSDSDKSAWSTEISFTPGVLTVNDGTTLNQYIPINGGNADQLTRCQFIIPSTTINGISNQGIDQLVFYSSNSSMDWGNATFDVYMKEVDNASFANASLVDWESLTNVYSGKLSISDNKMVVKLDDPFEYKGGNLLIGFKQTTKGTWNTSNWYVASSSNSTVYGYSTLYLAHLLPKTSIYYSPIVVAPRMVVDETPIAFGLVEANSTQTKTFTIQNKGKAALNGITVTCTGDAFSTTEVNNASIAVGGDAITVTVTFNTTTSGDHNGTITVNATDQEPATIAVSGTVRDANKIFIDFSESNPMPSTWSMASGWSVSNEMAYNNGTAANITSGEVVVADGGENIFFDYKGVNTWGETYDYVKVYYATTGNGTDADWKLIDNSTFGCTDATTWKQAKVTIPADAKYICLQGRYIYIDNFYGLSNPSGAIFAINTDGTSQDFGFVSQNTIAEKTYTITNSGNADMTVSIATPEGFSMEGCKTLKFTKPNDWNVVKVHAWNSQGDITTWPGTEATYLCNNDYNQAQYAIIVPDGATGIVINNGGNGAQTSDITDFNVEGYYIDNGTTKSWGSAPTVLTLNIAANGGTSDFTVKMNTETVGAKSGDVKLVFDALNEASFTIPVTGYVADASKFLETFAGNTLPTGWKVTGNTNSWSFANGVAASSYSSDNGYLVTPALTVEGTSDVMVFQAKSTFNGTVTITVQKSKNGGDWENCKAFYLSDSDYNVTRICTIDGLEAGSYKFRFKNDDYELDNVNGFTLDTDAPVLTVSPTTAADFGNKVKAQPEDIVYGVTNSGTGTLNVEISSSDAAFTVSPATMSLGAGESSSFTVHLVFDENYGEKSATITVHPTNGGLSDVTIAAIATTKDPNIWTEDFEDGTLPTGWVASSWTVGTFSSYEDKTPMALAPSGATAGTLITPRLSAKKDDILTWDAYLNWSDEALIVEYSSDEQATWTQIYNYKAQDDGISSRYYHKAMSFTAPADGNYYLRFTSTYQNGVDNFEGFKLNLADHVVAITASNIPSTGIKVGMSFNATVTVNELRGVAEELTAKLYIKDDVEDYEIGTVSGSVAANGTETLTIVCTPIQAGDDIEMYIAVTYAGGTLKTDAVTRTIDMPSLLQLSEEDDVEITTGTTFDLITLYRTYSVGWNTIVLPLSTNLSNFGEGAKAYEFTSYINGELKFSPITGNTLNPATPYLLYLPDNFIEETLQWENASISSLFVGTDNIKTTKDGATFQGTYAPIAAGGLTGNYGVTPAGEIRKASEHASIDGFRAYFILPANATAPKISINGEATSIDALRMNIGEDAVIYDLNGRRVETPSKGIYIINGKKVVIK